MRAGSLTVSARTFDGSRTINAARTTIAWHFRGYFMATLYRPQGAHQAIQEDPVHHNP
jgi:hypothetical protein